MYIYIIYAYHIYIYIVMTNITKIYNNNIQTADFDRFRILYTLNTHQAANPKGDLLQEKLGLKKCGLRDSSKPWLCQIS